MYRHAVNELSGGLNLLDNLLIYPPVTFRH